MATVFTIGHSTHPFSRFLELLARHGVATLADIRRFPGSRKHPQFNREPFGASLEAAGIQYEWLEELGGRRKASGEATSPNGGLRNASFRNYADYMLTADYREGIEKLLALAERRPTAIMCAEGLWWQCHRRLVSDYLLVNGHAVEHIFPDGQLKPHVLTPEARTDGTRVSYPAPNSLFGGEE
jgi:uncharacterized protein (DUF488 family)